MQGKTPRTETQQVAVGGHTLTVSAYGVGQPGTPLVLLHGAGGRYLHWPPHLRRLPGRPVYALEMPGHGETPGPGIDSLSAFVQVVQGWAEQAGIERWILAGHSLGGAIALSLALDAPARLAGLIVVGSGARLRVAPELLRLLQEEYAAAATWIITHSYAEGTPAAQLAHYREALLRTEPEALRGAYAACVGFDVRARLEALHAPTLIVGAADDRMTPPSLSRELHAALPESTLHLLPATGHMIPIEQPTLLTELVAVFLP